MPTPHSPKCHKCPAPAAKGKTLCAHHAKRSREVQAKLRAKRLALGNCLGCGLVAPAGGRTHCTACADKRNALARARHKKDPRKVYSYKLRKEYGLTLAQYNALFAAQGGACAICNQIVNGNLNVDHDHKTGKVRALLCAPCNLGIGNLREDPSLMEAAAAYIRSHKATMTPNLLLIA